jgi:hypothetical protein
MEQLVYNNYSKENAPKTLPRGKVVRFRAIGSEKRLQTLLMLPNEDYVWDEGANDGAGDMIQIGAIKRLRAEGKPEFYALDLNERQQISWVLFGGNREHMEIYRFLQKCNFNRSNLDRDTQYPPLIEEYDANSAVEEEAKRRELVRVAINAAASMTEKEVRDFYGGDVVSDISALRIRMEDDAKANPSLFSAKKEKNEERDVKDLVKIAEKKGIIKFDSEMNEWVDEDNILIVKCQKGVGHGKYADFAAWVESGDGKDMMDVIIERIS